MVEISVLELMFCTLYLVSYNVLSYFWLPSLRLCCVPWLLLEDKEQQQCREGKTCFCGLSAVANACREQLRNVIQGSDQWTDH